jgi:hypothetical protein
MLADSYQDILRRVQRLTIAEQPLHSILELEGLGMEVWKDVDVEKYIEEERNSWDG